MTEKLEQASDYKTCPLKRGTASDFLVLNNLDWTPEDLATFRRTGAIKVWDGSNKQSIEIIVGRCDGPRCAWWDAGRDKCAYCPRHNKAPPRS